MNVPGRGAESERPVGGKDLGSLRNRKKVNDCSRIILVEGEFVPITCTQLSRVAPPNPNPLYFWFRFKVKEAIGIQRGLSSGRTRGQNHEGVA